MQRHRFDPWARKIPHALEQVSPQPLGLCPRAREPQLLKPVCPETHAPQQGRPLQWGVWARHRESGPYTPQPEKTHTASKTQHSPRKENCERGLSFLFLRCWQDSDSCSKCRLLRCVQFVKIELYTCDMWTYLYVYDASVFYQKNLSFSVFPLPQGNFCNQFLVSFPSYFKHIKPYIFFFPTSTVWITLHFAFFPPFALNVLWIAQFLLFFF